MKIKTAVIILLLSISFSVHAQKKWTLKEAVTYALENNITIKQNALNVSLRKEDVVQAKGNFLPNLNASVNPGMNFGSSIGQDGSRISTNNFRSSFNLSSNATLFNGFRNLNTYKQAQLGVTSSKLELKKVEDDISLNVVNAYLNILFAKENLAVAKTQYDISKKQVAVTKTQVDEGAQPKSELLNAESSAATDAQNVVTQENTLNLALLTLAQLLQVSPDNFDIQEIAVDTPSAATLYSNSDLVYKRAVLNRPEVKKAELAVESADLSIDIAKGRYLPTVSLSAGMGTSYQHAFSFNNDYFFKQVNNNLGYSFGLSLSIPIFNRFQTKSAINQSIVNKKISEISLESQKLQLKATIERAFLDAKAAAKSFEAARLALVSQRVAFKNAQERYALGAMTLFDFEQVRNRFVNSESALIRAKYDFVFKTKVLKFYYGEKVFE